MSGKRRASVTPEMRKMAESLGMLAGPATVPPCDHTPCPSGYIAFLEWCDKMAKTHDQTQCPRCGLWAIWVLKGKTAVSRG